MTTIAIELTDEQAEQLAKEAQRLSVPMQELAVQRLFSPWTPEQTEEAPDFDAAMDYVFQKNSELYRRLA